MEQPRRNRRIADRDRSDLMAQIAEDSAVNRANVSNLTELIHDLRITMSHTTTALQSQLADHDRRIYILERNEYGTRSLRGALRWVLATIVAMAAVIVAWFHK